MQKFQVGGGAADRVVLEVQMGENCGVVELGEDREDEELAGTRCVPLLVVLTRVDVGGTAHQQERPHYAHDQHY